tara:strand:+ start:272 stop:409 length:138 start_codon:yes stop_codon:yes gene_type:complete
VNSGLGNLDPKFSSRRLNNSSKYLELSKIKNIFKKEITKKSDIQK